MIELSSVGLIGVISATSYLGVMALMALESAYLPPPSEIILLFARYLVSLGTMNLLWTATAGAAGCNLGSSAIYYLATRAERCRARLVNLPPSRSGEAA